MFDLLYDFFTLHVFNGDYGYADSLESYIFEIGSTNTICDMRTWLIITCSIITEIIIFTLCCLMIYKIVRLIGGLIR